MSSDEIEPWVILLNATPPAEIELADENVEVEKPVDSVAPSLAMWQLREGEQAALALFTDQAKAAAYARQIGALDFRLLQPTRPVLVSILIQYYQQQVRLAVLDPDECGARRIFNMRDCLKAAREQLVSSDNLFK